MERFRPEILQNQKIKKDGIDKNEAGKLTRRDFLKAAGAAAILVAGGDRVAKWLEKEGRENEDLETEETEEQKKITQEDIKSLDKIIDFDSSNPIKFNKETQEILENYWEERYRTDQKWGLEYAYREMGAFRSALEKIFLEEGVDKKYIYLAIPESHWKLNARSSSAVGPYQFTYQTAKSYGLEINDVIDERIDPLKSARACARTIKDLLDITKDERLALSGYNGGFIWDYLKKAKQNKEEINYKDYLKYLEDELNKIKKEVKESNMLTHTVRSQETLTNIANFYQIDKNELSALNKERVKNGNLVTKGSSLFLPLNNYVKRQVFFKKISGYKENINYPAKYYAVMKLINNNFVTEQKKEIQFRIIKVKQERGYKIYTFKKEDKNLFRLSQKYQDVKVKDLLRINPSLNPKKIPIGLKLKIPNQAISETLLALSKKYDLPLSRIKFLNPAVKKIDAPLPNGYEIRV